jgi:hypothetical protein
MIKNENESNLEYYKRLMFELMRLQKINNGNESPEEDSILDVMDDAWYVLTDEEQEQELAEDCIDKG